MACPIYYYIYFTNTQIILLKRLRIENFQKNSLNSEMSVIIFYVVTDIYKSLFFI